MFDYTSDPEGKLLLQNDDDNLFVGMDMINFQTESPSTTWGCAVYLDINHDASLTNVDRGIRLKVNSSGDFVEYFKPGTVSTDITVIESGELGETLSSSGILLDTSFTTSIFNENNDHRQFEIKIPLLVLSCGPGGIRGVAFEAFENFADGNGAITWPYIKTAPINRIRWDPGTWGDLHLGIDGGDSYVQYLIDDNFNIKSTTTGYNNGTFFATGDINGDDDLELIVSSNRTVTSDENLLAIFDYIDGEYQRIWSSWETSHQSKMFRVTGITTHDFDGNGEDEIYVCGKTSKILRFLDWNETAQDFDHSETAFTHSTGLMGYIDIGDADNDGYTEIVCGDQNGKLLILYYSSSYDSFYHDYNSPYTPEKILGDNPERIHAVEIANMDADGENEILFASQITDDNDLSTTRLQIIERGWWDYYDNSEDDLPEGSHENTEDRFCHSIIAADIDNDGWIETIIVGKDYLKIFNRYSFDDASPPLVLALTDGSDLLQMAGGAAVADIDDDDDYELIFGCNNGTIVIGEVTDYGYSFIVEWSGDFGTSPGKREAIVVHDFDEDGEKEIIVGDNFGQILVLGKSKPPELSISWPNPGYISGKETITVWWDVTEDSVSMHHYNIYVDTIFVGRAGGGQSGFVVGLSEGENNVTIIGYDITGKSDSDSIIIQCSPGSPQVTVITPSNNHPTSANTVTIEYLGEDPEENIDHFEIYRDGTQIESYTTETSYTVSLPSDGQWNITVVVVDETSNTGRDSVIVIRDTEAPEIELISPIDGSAVKGSETELIWTASDSLTEIDYYEVFKDGEFYETAYSKSCVVDLALDKEYLLEVTAYDVVGNHGTDSVSITRDTIEPELIIDPLPLPKIDGDIYYTDSPIITIFWNTTDNLGGTGIDHSELTLNGQLIGEYSASETDVTIDLGDDETKNLLMTTYDKAGNSAQNHLTVIVDRTNPIIEIKVPEDNYTTGLEHVLVSWESSDIGTGIQRYLIWIDGESTTVINDPEERFYYASIPQNKTFTITVQALDFLDHLSEDTISVTHDSFAPTLEITNLMDLYSYSRFTEFNISWQITNLEPEGFEIHKNGSLIGNYSSSTREATIDFGSIPINEFPLLNITIYAVVQGELLYKDYRWIIIDQAIPTVSIITPEDQDTILDQVLYVKWSGSDEGSGILKYTFKVNDEMVGSWGGETTFQYVNFEAGDGKYNLTVEIFDKAGNFTNNSIQLKVYFELPEFTTNLNDPYYTNTGVFQFNLTITNTRMGVTRLEVYADKKQAFNQSYEENIQKSPFWHLINISEECFENVPGEHNLTISVHDIYYRERIEEIEVIIDQTPPDIETPSIETYLLGSSPPELELFDEEGTNIHNLNITVRDEYGIIGVNVTILGKDFNQTFQMNFAEKKGQDTYKYNLAINLTGFSVGDYALSFIVMDFAGNYATTDFYNITLISPSEPPWISRGDNLLYVSLGSVLGIVLAIILLITLPGPISNIGWRDAVVAVSYTKKSGLACIFVPYSPDLIKDEQLFGGAMSGIRGVLEEITGQKVKFKIQTVEFGDRKLLIYPGEYGDGILMVNKSKPILKERLKQFTWDFEAQFRKELSRVSVAYDTFAVALIMVESYFCARRLVGLERAVEEIPSVPREVAMPVEPRKTLSMETRALVDEVIKSTQNALASLIERKFDQAEEYSQTAIYYLRTVLQTGELLPDDVQKTIELTPRVVEEIFKGVTYGRRGEVGKLRIAIEKASQIFLEQFT